MAPIKKLFALFILLGVAQVQAVPIHVLIDGFSEDQAQKVTGAGTCDTFNSCAGGSVLAAPGTQAGSAGSILGGYRDVFIEETGGTNDVSIPGLGTVPGTGAGTSVRIGPGNNGGAEVFTVDNDTGVTDAVVVVWDGSHEVTADPRTDANIATGGLGGVDFTPFSTSNGILLDVLSIDLNVTATLDLWDMAGQKAGVAHTFSQVESHLFRFDDFLAANGSLNLDQVGAVRLTLTGPAAWDGQFRLVGVVPVPEPAGLALFGTGLVLLARRRKALG